MAQERKGLLEETTEEKGNGRKKKESRKQEVKTPAARKTDVDDEREGNRSAVFFVTMIIIIVWLAIFALLIKWDVGGFGSKVLRPILKDVPVINSILPSREEEFADEGYPYATLVEAVEQIKSLELELQVVREENNADKVTIEQLNAEIDRLKAFEGSQAEFESVKSEFYNEVVFTENAPDISEYQKYYESIDPANAEVLYKQIVQQTAYSAQVREYAGAYGAMKPAQAAGILEAMTDDTDLAAQILENISTDARGEILGAMDPDIAAKITKIMAPEKGG